MRLFVCAALLCAGMASAETWRGLTVAPEHCCSPYRAADYSYPQSVDPLIVAQIGKVYGPYTGRCFASSSTWWRGRKRMTAGCAPPLPRPPAAGSLQVRADDRSARGRCAGARAVGLSLHGDGLRGVRSGLRAFGRPARSLRRQRQQTDHLRRSAAARDRARAAQPPGLLLHARRRRRGLRIAESSLQPRCCRRAPPPRKNLLSEPQHSVVESENGRTRLRFWGYSSERLVFTVCSWVRDA